MLRIPLNIQRFAAGVSISGSDGEVSVASNTSYINGTITISTSGDTWNQSGTAYYQVNGGPAQYFSIGKNSSVSFGYRLGPYTHNSDGSLGPQTVSVYVRVTSSTSTSGSISVPMQTIPRYAHTDSVSGSNIENPFKINYTKYVSGYTYKLRISLPGITALETRDYNTSGAEITLSKASIEAIYDRYPDTNTFNLGFAVETYNGGTKVSSGNEVTIQATKTDRIARLRISGEWKRAVPYIRVSGEWKKAIPYTRINNEWKRGR